MIASDARIGGAKLVWRIRPRAVANRRWPGLFSGPAFRMGNK